MSALYFLSGALVTSGILMQSFGRGPGWGWAILLGALIAILATAAENWRSK